MVEVSAEHMAVLRYLRSFQWIADGAPDAGASLSGIIAAYLEFVGSTPSMKAGVAEANGAAPSKKPARKATP